jgi:hypothetical protein
MNQRSVGDLVSQSLLVQHSIPYPTESLVGYLLRLSEKNA